MRSEGTKSDTLGVCVGSAFKTTHNENRSVHNALECLTLNLQQHDLTVSALSLEGGRRA